MGIGGKQKPNRQTAQRYERAEAGLIHPSAFSPPPLHFPLDTNIAFLYVLSVSKNPEFTQFNFKASPAEMKSFRKHAKERHLTLTALIRILLHEDISARSQQSKVA